ncbi:MAG: acyloxyacyl hydrolase [Proteobacteria bacterium]|nr:acyloxyacyl hydrolase [Pseudomonadota bacterium]
MRILLTELFLFLFIVGVFPAIGQSAESEWNEAGVRIVIPANQKREYFHQYDAFAVYGLPWDWHNSSGWGVKPKADFSLGVLSGGGETSIITSAGPGLILYKQGIGLAADVGINADILGRRHFGKQDFGSMVLFGAYMGLNYRFSNNIKIGYRLQHISNGHIFYPKGTPNPGLDTHLFGISYAF